MRSIRATVLVALTVVGVAVVPAGASASGAFVANDYPATVEGSQISTLAFEFGSADVYCINNDMTFDATLEGVEPIRTEAVSDPFCGSHFVHTNDCQLEFHPGSENVAIVPASCEGIDVYTPSCGWPVTILPQEDVAASYSNVGPPSEGTVNVAVDDDAVEYEVGPNLCASKGTHTDMTVFGEFEMAAVDSEESTTSISATAGLFLEGGLAETGEPRITSPTYPVQISGGVFDLELEGWEAGQTLLFEEPEKNRKTVCQDVEYDGGEMTEDRTDLTLYAEYTGCEFTSIVADIDMGSCAFHLSDFERDSLFDAAAAIACDEGDAIEIDIGNGTCAVEIPAQTLTDRAPLATPAAGYESRLAAILAADDLSYTVEGLFCAFVGLETGSREDGVTHSDLLLRGV